MDKVDKPAINTSWLPNRQWFLNGFCLQHERKLRQAEKAYDSISSTVEIRQANATSL